MKYLNELRVINDICVKINYACSQKYYVEKCETLFRAIEIIFDSYWDYANKNNLLSHDSRRYLSNSEKPSKNKKFIETTLALLIGEGIDELIGSKMLNDLVHFRPHIMSDEVLENQRYNPNKISSELRIEAAKTHYDLINSNLERNNRKQISRLCRLLYLIRSNLMHCGKTPYGPDLDKSIRDEEVCKIIYPILSFLLNSFLEHPNSKLILYGTLRRNGVNHYLIKDFVLNIQDVLIWGYIENIDSLPFYNYSLTSEKIGVELLENPKLIRVFETLDRFEGKKYQRELVPYLFVNDIYIANIYSKSRA